MKNPPIHDETAPPHLLLPMRDVVRELGREFPETTQSSLRFFERAGLVRPTRTPGGHRLYAPEDLARVRQIKRWQAERLSLAEIRSRLELRDALEGPAVSARRFLDLALQGDGDGAVGIVRRADELGMPLETIFMQVLTPALVEVGDRWERGKLPVGQEKEISELARGVIAELSGRHAPDHTEGPSTVAACVAGELHDLGLRMVVGLLRQRGWRAYLLGPDVATPFLLESVRLRQPAVVLLSASTPERLLALAETIIALRAVEMPGGPPGIVVGGRVVRDHAATLSAWGVTAVEYFALDPIVKAATRGDSLVPSAASPDWRATAE
jgi:methanogenic corrinoid protein MtbC1